MSNKKNKNWTKYIKNTKGRKPVGFLLEAVKILKERIGENNGRALDLGCGAGNEVKYLAENGFGVEAVDIENAAIKSAKELSGDLPVKVIKSDVVDYSIKNNTYDLIICWRTIPFVKKEKAIDLLKRIQDGLKKNGLFVFSVFGPEDDWVKDNPKMSSFEYWEMKKFLSKLSFIRICEEQYTAPSVSGEIKFCHFINGIAEKK